MSFGFKKPTSMLRRIERFFTDNPHEELTIEQLKAKFDIPHRSVKQYVHELRASGLLETVRIVRRAEHKP